MPKFQVMVGKGPELERYDEYLQYVEDGERKGTMSHEEWLAYERDNYEPPDDPVAWSGGFADNH